MSHPHPLIVCIGTCECAAGAAVRPTRQRCCSLRTLSTSVAVTGGPGLTAKAWWCCCCTSSTQASRLSCRCGAHGAAAAAPGAAAAAAAAAAASVSVVVQRWCRGNSSYSVVGVLCIVLWQHMEHHVVSCCTSSTQASRQSCRCDLPAAAAAAAGSIE
jgi:hypothetical protein